MNNPLFFKLIRFRKLLKHLFFSISVSIILLLSSCVKEGDFEFDKLAKNQFDPTLAAPFVNSKLTLQDILKDTSGIVQVDIATNALKLVYNSNNLVSIMAKDLFEIPNQSIQTDTANLNLVPPTGDSNYYSIIKPYTFHLPKTDQRVDSVFIKNATLKLNINTNINHKGRIKLTIPNIKRPDGNEFSIEMPINYNGQSTPYIVVIPPIDMSGYKIIFNNTPGHKNEVTFKYEHYIYKNPVYPYTNPYFIELNDALEDISYNKLFGYIGQYEFPLNDTTLISVFNSQLEGHFELYNIKVGVKVENSYGLPIEIKIDKFQAQNGNIIRNINDFPSTNPFSLNYPDVNHIGQSINTTLPLSPSTDLANAINISPKKIIYKITGKANPANNPGIQNFVIDTSKFNVSVNLELPLEGKVGGFVLQDTIEFDLAEKIKDVNEITFRINTSNHFPLDANVQVYFANQFNQIIDSMISTGENVINSGIVDVATHVVTHPSSKLTEVTITNERVRRIETMKTKKLIIRGKLTSFNNGTQDVKITNIDYLEVKLGMKAKVIINP